MRDNYRDGIIVSNVEIGPNIYKLVLEGNFTGQPGQFYMLRGWNSRDPFLARPFSIADLEEGRISFLYETKGRGSKLISELKQADSLSILGPLGRGFDLEERGKIAIVTGGVGIAPILYLAKNLRGRIDLYSGFRSESYFLEEIEAYVDNIYIATEDGSQGHKGFVTEVFQPEKYDLVLSCGPTPMMKRVVEMCKGIVPIYISMESRMACGIGACLGCTVETSRGMERVCKEGPVFKGEEVVGND